MKPQPDVEFAAFAGIDWSETKHDICVQAANSGGRELAVVPHRPAAIDAWAKRAATNALPSLTQGGSPVRELRTLGSVRGVSGNRYPYRDPRSNDLVKSPWTTYSVPERTDSVCSCR